MNNKFKYLHFLITWLVVGVCAEICITIAITNKSLNLTESHLNLIHGFWLLFLPIGTLFYIVLFISDLYDWFSMRNTHSQIEDAIKARQ